MALRFVDASSQYLSNSNGLDLTNCSIVVACRVNSGTPIEDVGGIIHIADGSGHYIDIMFADLTGYHDVRLECDAVGTVSNYEFSAGDLGDWFAVAITRSGANTTFRVTAENSGSWLVEDSQAVSGAGPYTATVVECGRDRMGRHLEADVHFIKMWSGSILTGAQLLTECGQNTPTITTNLSRWYDMEGANLAAHLEDDHTNNYDWTATNSPTVVANSSIPYGGGASVSLPPKALRALNAVRRGSFY